MTGSKLESYYYLDAEGKPDEMVQIIGECLTRNMFFALREYVEDIDKLYIAYMNELTYELTVKPDNKIANIRNIRFLCFDDIVIIKNKTKVMSDGKKSLEGIKSLLDKGEFVFVRTLMSKLKFYKDFSTNDIVEPDLNYLDDANGHVFLMLTYDSKYFYFVENIININKQLFVPFEKNKGIGIIEESDLLPALNYFAEYSTLAPNYDELKKLEFNIIPRLIEETVNNYFNEKSINEAGNTNYYGRAVIKKFKQICEEGKFILNDKLEIFISKNNNTINKSSIITGFNNLVFRCGNRKKLLKYFFNKAAAYDPVFIKMIDVIDKNIYQWELIKSSMQRDFVLEKFILDPRFIGYFNDLLTAEDNLFDILHNESEAISKAFSVLK